MPFLSFLTGPLGKAAGIAAALIALLTAGAIALRQHDARVIAAQNAAVEAQQLQDMQQLAVRTEAALQAQHAASQAMAVQAATLRAQLNALPHTSSCSSSAAVRDLLVQLRQ